MVVSADTYKNLLYQTDESLFSGVVRVISNGYYGTGSLLYDGTAILTAAHIFTGSFSDTYVQFESSDGSTKNISASSVLLQPDYDTNNDNNDLAIVFLDEKVSSSIQRYDIYRQNDELFQDFIAVGYGRPGIGLYGEDTSATELLRLQTTNTFETFGDTLKDVLGNIMAWDPLKDSILVADFDDGSSAHDALGAIMDINDTGTGITEGLISSGDSGGPAFINAHVAGIASYTSSLSSYSSNPDIDDISNNSSFGELGFWQRVSYNEEWIDKALRSNYKDVPTSKDDVKQAVSEQDSVVYFFVELLNAPTDRGEQSYSVDYTTRDGTAKASEDYIAVSGTLNIYNDETYAVIAVELIDDTLYEEDEVFYLEVTNPVGASFSEDAISLVASRTILNDDFLI